MKRFGQLVLLAYLLVACTRSIPFDKERWAVKDGVGGYRWRAEMLNDLETHHAMDGEHLLDVIVMLGPPDFAEGNERFWTITIDHGMDIDPVHLKYLVLTLEADSMVASHATREIDH